MALGGPSLLAPRAAPTRSLSNSGTLQANQILTYRYGVPTSLQKTGQQWDFPNAWAPLQDLVIRGREAAMRQIPGPSPPPPARGGRGLASLEQGSHGQRMGGGLSPAALLS